jgi:16S rRNA (cytidine1402-2'-O)-methyltransferase
MSRKRQNPPAPERGKPTAAGVLHVVATPIGNLGDLSPRAREVLAGADLVVAEDTRAARRLLSANQLSRPLLSCHAHNEDGRASTVVGRLNDGASVALISEAGTPAISDPGSRLVAAAAAAGIAVVAVPGACAVSAALSVSGFSADGYLFLGFPPRRGAERRRMLERAAAEALTTVLFEAPHRLERTLKDLAALAPGRPAVLARELTKRFEELQRASLAELAAGLEQRAPRGEYTLVLGPQQRPEQRMDGQQALEVARQLVAAGLPPSRAAKQAARGSRASGREVYRALVADARETARADDEA